MSCPWDIAQPAKALVSARPRPHHGDYPIRHAAAPSGRPTDAPAGRGTVRKRNPVRSPALTAEEIGGRARNLGAVSPSVGDDDNTGVIVSDMKLGVTKTNDELIGERLRTDPEFRAEWERTALARAVAVAIVRYRGEHDLSQRELGQRLGMKQPQVARLELGEVNPSMETLMRVSAALGIEFTIDVRPTGTPAHNVTRQAQANDLVGSFRANDAEIIVAAR